jgi:hypothetical protein
MGEGLEGFQCAFEYRVRFEDLGARKGGRHSSKHCLFLEDGEDMNARIVGFWKYCKYPDVLE